MYATCAEYLEALAECSGKVSSKWTCPQCGSQEFSKEADPVAAPLWPEIDPFAVVLVAFMVLIGVMAYFSIPAR